MKLSAIPAAAAAILFGQAAAFAQGDAERQRQDLLRTIRSALEEARNGVLRGVDRILTEEIARAKPPSPAPPGPGADATKAEVKRLEDRLGQLRQEERAIHARLMELRWAERDASLREELRKSGLTPEEARGLFRDALDAHNDEDFKVSIPAFKKIYYAYSGHQNAQLRTLASISAYNVSCGYSLDKKSDEALDWLDLSLAKGFLTIQDQCHDSALDHIHADTDLDNIRKHDRFKEILKKHSAQ
jgi:hypothetical protein